MQRNFEPMQKQVKAWQRSELSDVTLLQKWSSRRRSWRGGWRLRNICADGTRSLLRAEGRGISIAYNLESLQCVYVAFKGCSIPSHSSRQRRSWANSLSL